MKEIVEKKFVEIFGTEGRFKTYFTPERANIIDETVNEQNIPEEDKEGIYATVRKREDRILNFYSMNFSEEGIISFSIDNVMNNENEGWIKYPKEIIQILITDEYNLEHGLDIVFYENIKSKIEEKLPATLKALIILIIKDVYNIDVDNERFAIVEKDEEENFEQNISKEKLTIL